MSDTTLNKTTKQENSQKIVTKEELLALQLNSLINGVNLEQISLNSQDTEQDTDLDLDNLEFDFEPKKKKEKTTKTKKSTSEKKTKAKKEKEPEMKFSKEVPMLNVFKQIKNNMEVEITYNEHDIHYKEQLWGIPERKVKYVIKPAVLIKSAKDISNIMNHNSEEERKKAEEGLVRYYSVVTYENVLHKLYEIGYVRIRCEENKLKATVLVKSQLLKDNNANPDKVRKQIVRKVQQMMHSEKLDTDENKE